MTCKHGLPALAGGKHQPPINSPAGSHLSSVQWREEAEPSQTVEDREGPSPSAVNFGQNEGNLLLASTFYKKVVRSNAICMVWRSSGARDGGKSRFVDVRGAVA